MRQQPSTIRWVALVIATAVIASIVAQVYPAVARDPGTTSAAGAAEHTRSSATVNIDVLAPEHGSSVGLGGRGWVVDLAVDFRAPLSTTGFSGFQLTGPAGHNGIPPFPGSFSVGRDERLPGLVVLLSTTTVGAGPGQNLANLFNLTGIGRSDDKGTQLWDTWIVGAPNFGIGTESTLYAAVVADLDGNGVYDDAPSTVADSDADGDVDRDDLEAIGLASKVASVDFFVNP